MFGEMFRQLANNSSPGCRPAADVTHIREAENERIGCDMMGGIAVQV